MDLSRGVLPLILLTCALSVSACSDPAGRGSSRDQRPEAREGPPPQPVQFRRVLPAPVGSTPTSCTALPTQQPDPEDTVRLCGLDATSYVVGPAEIVGGVQDAETGQQGTTVTVLIELDGETTDRFATLSRDLVGTGQQLAIVSRGVVVSAPVIQTEITDGRVQIAGSFTREEADDLADALESAAAED